MHTDFFSPTSVDLYELRFRECQVRPNCQTGALKIIQNLYNLGKERFPSAFVNIDTETYFGIIEYNNNILVSVTTK